MSNLLPVEPRYISWKCPKCGHEIMTAGKLPGGVMTAFSLKDFLGIWESKPPVCKKCGTTMERRGLL